MTEIDTEGSFSPIQILQENFHFHLSLVHNHPHNITESEGSFVQYRSHQETQFHLRLVHNGLHYVRHQITVVIHENLPVLFLHHLSCVLLDEVDHLLLHLAI